MNDDQVVSIDHKEKDDVMDNNDNIRSKRGTKRKQRKRLCHEFSTKSSCKFGSNCKFAHGENELKKKFRKPVLSKELEKIREEAKKRDSSSMRKTIPFSEAGFSNLYGDFVNRYFRELFYVPEGTTSEDQYVNVHRNELCVVGLAPGHPILARNLEIKYVSFKYDLKSLSGKKKKKAPKLAPDSTFCTITCKDNSVWKIRGGIQGNLWEINTRVCMNPSLISTRSRTDGYLGIVMPSQKLDMSRRSNSIYTNTEYNILRERRKMMSKTLLSTTTNKDEEEHKKGEEEEDIDVTA